MSTQTPAKYPELADAFQDVKRYFIYAGFFSAAVNLLMLVPVIYMLQVYDRVISSGSYSTLAMLTLLMVALTAALGRLRVGALDDPDFGKQPHRKKSAPPRLRRHL